MFGGINGITFFNPAEITDQEKELHVQIIDFYIHNKPVKQRMRSGPYEIIDKSILEASFIQLSHQDNSFSIEFSVLEFTSPERISYSYAINNGKWINLSPGNNRITFNNLAPGKYNLKVKAQDYNTVSEAKEITIQIHPVWYFSAWAKLLYAFLFSLIVFIITHQVRQRNRAKRKLQEHIHAEQLNEAKLEFFMNISHEIRTPISLIINPLIKLIKNDKDSDRQKAYMTMHRNSSRILQLANQLMDIRKIDKGQMRLQFQQINIVCFIKDLVEIFDDQIQSKNIRFKFASEAEEIFSWIDPNNFDKVILNLVSNALKFTPSEGEISVYLKTFVNQESETQKEYAEIMVADSGIGIAESEKERIFDRFYQIRNTGTNSYEGTGIGLHLTRSLVELHHGRIWVERNEEGKGCRFIIHLPLGNAHLNQEEIIEKPTVQKQEVIPPGDSRLFTRSR